jgi:transcriptional regulator GlxA family with amidase domain
MGMTRRHRFSDPQGRGALPRDVKVAIAYMRANLASPICVADLLVATGAPERTLRKHFRRFLGVAPLEFLRRLRLAATRDALLCTPSDSVTTIAVRFGFAHFGRFSSDYRRCFGELPSTTRRRATSTAPALEPCQTIVPPTLVVVPFRTHGDRETNYLAEGLAEVLAAELARGHAFVH